MKKLIGKPVVVRGYYCGNWAGTLVEIRPSDKTAVLKNAYRLWQWETNKGICLSAVATYGVHEKSKISCPVSIVQLGDCYEVIAATEEAMETIKKAVK
ncbi:MAG: hypothetical protein LBC19_13680 [Tannerella sp.]|jgi:hypothetical protein|nr:hypothetical protein [Tannerella sp.]